LPQKEKTVPANTQDEGKTKNPVELQQLLVLLAELHRTSMNAIPTVRLATTAESACSSGKQYQKLA
jgi:hypothetical protein